MSLPCGLRISVACFLTAMALSGSAAAQTGSPLPAGFSAQYLDRGADACTDFYQFACGNWLATHPLPADRTRFGRMHELAERNELIVRGILERAAARTTGRTANEQKVGDYYASCMAEPVIEAKGSQPLQPLLRDIDGVQEVADLMQLAARLNRIGVGTFLTLGSAPDARDSSTFIATIGQGTLGLPDRDLYLQDNARSETLRAEYVRHVRQIFELLGVPAPRATAMAQAVMAVETVIARGSYDRVTLRDPRRRDNPMSIEDLAALAPNLGIPGFIRETGAPAFTRANVINPQYVRDISAAIQAGPLSDWKAYMTWRTLSVFASLLSSPFQIERFRFTGAVLGGQREMQPRWKRCSAAVAGVFGDDQLGEIVGQLFIEEHFGAAAAARITELIAALERSLQRNIEEIAWMSPETRAQALEKLKATRHKIGAPESWRDFSSITISRDNYMENTLSVARDTARRNLGWIGQKVERGLWLMTPQTVNAYYAAPLNEIVFPAGILQPPFFDTTKDDALNFGAIGAVIGHELTHGFDDQGRKYDAKGNLSDWWAAADDAAFRNRASCMATQYGAYPAVGDVKLNGNLTLGENVADNAGVRIAYYALIETLARKAPQPLIDGFTAEQRFFLAWAQVWCENATEQDFRRRAQEDTHSSGRWRANGVLQNSAEFRKAFGCRTGTPMAPENMCRVW